ncbi:MAG: iron-containing alcohol dehydrogenase family protein [Alphaproteobacteria bacterium]
MIRPIQVTIPSLVRIKPDALDRLGIYLARNGHREVALLVSEGMVPTLVKRAEASFSEHGVRVVARASVEAASFEAASTIFTTLPTGCAAIVGLGGGRALDTAKYVAFLARRPYYAVPTSLSNDGFSSSGASLTLAGRRRSLASALPFAVVVDTEVCRQAPDRLWWSGIGDLLAKVTAIHDWKLAFHRKGTPVNDFAALLSDATVYQFIGNPNRELEGIRLLATALMLNGIAMEICGSSRPASGSEHLISHALDEISPRRRAHGIQVGLATYVVSQLQGHSTERVGAVFDVTGFWKGVRAESFSRREWLEAVRAAPAMKEDFYTVLSERNCVAEVERILDEDPRLVGCFEP